MKNFCQTGAKVPGFEVFSKNSVFRPQKNGLPDGKPLFDGRLGIFLIDGKDENRQAGDKEGNGA